MRYSIVTETYPPEITGVALTVQGLGQGLRLRGHEVTVVRPQQPADANAATDRHTLLVRGAALPHYPGLRLGLPKQYSTGAVFPSGKSRDLRH